MVNNFISEKQKGQTMKQSVTQMLKAYSRRLLKVTKVIHFSDNGAFRSGYFYGFTPDLQVIVNNKYKEKVMTIQTIFVNDKELGVNEEIEVRSGSKTDDQGYIQPTYNLRAWIVIAEDGKRYAGANDNGDTYECIEWAGSLNDYLNNWDYEWVENFKSEGILNA